MESDVVRKTFVDDLIALCHILNEFEKFNSNMKQLSQTKYNRADIKAQLERVSNGKRIIIGAKVFKQFYYDNKRIIDIINQYSNINSFIAYNYKLDGQLEDDTVFFYNYLIKNKDNIKQVIEVLEKIKKIGFERIIFNQRFDFTHDEYSMDIEERTVYNTPYLDNMYLVSNPLDSILKYKTNKSCYKILDQDLYNKSCNRAIFIYLNDLVFDAKRLPNEITIKFIYDSILELRTKLIKDKVKNIDVEINDIDNLKDNDKLKKALVQIKSELSDITDIMMASDKQVFDQENEHKKNKTTYR